MPAPDAQQRVSLLRAAAFRTQRVDRVIEERDQTIRNAVAAGLSVIDVADAVGMTRQRVYQIVRAGGRS